MQVPAVSVGLSRAHRGVWGTSDCECLEGTDTPDTQHLPYRCFRLLGFLRNLWYTVWCSNLLVPVTSGVTLAPCTTLFPPRNNLESGPVEVGAERAARGSLNWMSSFSKALGSLGIFGFSRFPSSAPGEQEGRAFRLWNSCVENAHRSEAFISPRGASRNLPVSSHPGCRRSMKSRRRGPRLTSIAAAAPPRSQEELLSGELPARRWAQAGRSPWISCPLSSTPTHNPPIPQLGFTQNAHGWRQSFSAGGREVSSSAVPVTLQGRGEGLVICILLSKRVVVQDFETSHVKCKFPLSPEFQKNQSSNPFIYFSLSVLFYNLHFINIVIMAGNKGHKEDLSNTDESLWKRSKSIRSWFRDDLEKTWLEIIVVFWARGHESGELRIILTALFLLGKTVWFSGNLAVLQILGV